MRTYEETLAFIHSVSWKGSKPGLERTQELLARMGNPEKKLKFVHIAGTNGKGSTAAMIASMLQHGGYRVGLYTSPFIYTFNERFQVNGENISDEELIEITDQIAPHAEAMKDSPTEFELVTAIGMVYFLRQKCDIVVLEVGMGGELDSTNVIPVPEVAVITAIGLDHTKELGDTIAKIASAKAGIIKEGGDVVIYGQDPEAEAVFEKVCEEKHAHLHRPNYDTLNPVMHNLSGQIFDYNGCLNLKIPLLGNYQMYNAAVALTAMRVLNRKEKWFVCDEDIRKGLAEVRWGGRLDLLSEHPIVIVDGSHNPHGIRATVDSLKEYLPGEKFIFLMGVMADKDVAGEMGMILPLAAEFVTLTPYNPGRAMPAEELARRLKELTDVPVTAAASIEKGCEIALAHAGRHGAVCAIGSLFQVGDVTRAMKARLGK